METTLAFSKLQLKYICHWWNSGAPREFLFCTLFFIFWQKTSILQWQLVSFCNENQQTLAENMEKYFMDQMGSLLYIVVDKAFRKQYILLIKAPRCSNDSWSKYAQTGGDLYFKSILCSGWDFWPMHPHVCTDCIALGDQIYSQLSSSRNIPSYSCWSLLGFTVDWHLTATSHRSPKLHIQEEEATSYFTFSL